MQINTPMLEAEGVRKVIETFDAYKTDSVRLVGGCVRDAIMEREVNDIDFATPLTPDVVTDIFTAAGFHVEPTGVEHGTVTVIWNKEPFEITTLRRDVETDGRRAVVAFTEVWAEDAFRRDFTFNALYLAPDGTVFDYGGGIDDALNRRIRFMGDAEQRIREDYLRILRMFRFQSVLKARIDDEALAAAALLKDGIDLLSGERLEKETLKLLNGEWREVALLKMAETGIFTKVFGTAVPAERDGGIGVVLTRLNRQKSMPFVPPLAVVLAWDAPATEALMNRWKASRALRTRVADLVAAGRVSQWIPVEDVRTLSFYQGVEMAQGRLGLSWVVWPERDREVMQSLLAAAQDRPVFPLLGRDVVALGVKPGKVVGDVLRAVEDRWVAADFPEETVVREMLTEEVNRVVYA